jgi:dolichol-phosphate mannosyltransferase
MSGASESHPIPAPPPRPADASISVVVPAYNEEQNVERVYERLSAVLDGLAMPWELIFSVDPSTDATEQLILALRKRDKRVKMLRFSRRFGQPMATLAGLEAASGDAVIVIDCDLQDPPELIPELVERWREGYEVVYAQRRTRAGETLAKRIIANVGYRLIARVAEVQIPPNTGDFRLLSRRVVENVLALSESHGFLRGLVALVGFRQTSVLYDRDPRAAGDSKYNRFWGSLVIGLNGLIGFSRYPLHLISLGGIALSGFAFALAVAYGTVQIIGQTFPVGNPTIVIVVCFFSGIQLFSLGVMGEYVGRIYDESRRRPKYIVESQYGWDSEVTSPRPTVAGLPPVCILAGGLGRRLGGLVRDTPKPLLEVAGEPFLLHQLRLLAAHGAQSAVLCVGYLGEQIESAIGCERFGISISYSFDGPDLDGTLGAVRRALPLLGDRFLVLYGDTYLTVDYAKADRAWRASGMPAMMSVLRNDGRWDTSNALYADGRVVAYDKRAPTADMRWIDYGLGGLTAEALALADNGEQDLSDLYARLAARGLLCGYETTERFYEIGSERGLRETDSFLSSTSRHA